MIRFTIPIFIILAAIPSPAQPKTDATLLSDYKNPNCETMAGTLDSLRHNVKMNPDDQFVAIIKAAMRPLNRNLEYEAMITQYIDYRGLKNKVTIVRAGFGEDVEVQLWQVPPGGAIPNLQPIDWPLSISHKEKGFVVSYGEFDNTDTCPNTDRLAILKELIAANSTSKVNVVLRGFSIRAYAKAKRRILHNLLRKYEIESQRIRFFPALANGQYNWNPPEEYWFVP